MSVTAKGALICVLDIKIMKRKIATQLPNASHLPGCGR
jgi:hypothetical protein